MAVFRVEKTKDFTVMSNHHLRNVSLSLKAKGLLSLMLSLPDNWDYTTKGLAHICKDGVDSISSAIKELEKQGYLTRRRLRDYHGRLGDIEYVIHEKPVLPDGHDTVLPPKRENPRQVKPVLGKPEQEKPAQLNIQESITEKSITDRSNTHQSIYPASGRMPSGSAEMDRDRIDRIDTYREIIKENIEFEALVHRYGYERVDELVELMLQTVLSQRPYIRIAGDNYPREVVKSRFLKVNFSHVEYVFDCLDNNTTKVRNIKSYLLAALYNAPTTMDSYYRAEVNHDLYG